MTCRWRHFDQMLYQRLIRPLTKTKISSFIFKNIFYIEISQNVFLVTSQTPCCLYCIKKELIAEPCKLLTLKILVFLR